MLKINDPLFNNIMIMLSLYKYEINLKAQMMNVKNC